MELALWRPQLQDILLRDADRATAAATIPAVQAMWSVIQQAGDAADVCKAALVYSLSEATVEDEAGIPRAKWELTRIAANPFFEPDIDDPDEELLPYSATWQEFCLVHLGMSKSTGSRYKRIWAVFNKKLGYGLDDLFRAGVFKLGATLATLDRQLRAGEGIDQRLITALFGSPTTCSVCSGYVPFPSDAPPAECPHCGEDYQGVQPWSGARTILLLNQVKQEMQGGEPQGFGKLDVFGSLENAYNEANEVVMVNLLVECAVGETKSSLPGWELNVIPDDAPEGTLGVRQCHLEALRAWLRRKIPGI